MEKRVYYGGQAVLEGVMMRGRDTVVTAVRRPDGGLAVESQPLPKIYSGKIRKIPLLRGIIVMIETLVLGIKTTLHSANLSLEEEEEEISGWFLWLIVAASVAFAVVLFFLVPLWLTNLLNIESSLLFNVIDGVIRVVILVVYLALMSFVPDIKRVFAYHGAEHKVVNAYENGVPLETEEARQFNTAHVRCGTSFIFTVLIISIFVFALIGIHTTWLMVLSRILLVPVIAALSYEVIYFSGRHTDNRLVRIIMTPGLLLQSLTTREPDDSKIEVALSALRRVIEIENPEDVTWEPVEEKEELKEGAEEPEESSASSS